MRNLELFDISRQFLNDSYEDASNVVFTENYVCVIKNDRFAVYNSSTGELIHDRTSPNFGRVTHSEYLVVEKLIWCATSAEFICINPVDNSQKIIKPCSTCTSDHTTDSCSSCGFAAAVWNPAQDTIVIVKADGEVGTYVVDFEAGVLVELQSSNINNEIAGEELLGWGSADTQFRSKEEKAAAEAFQGEEALQECDGVPRVSWRANGEMFAVNYLVGVERKFKVFQYPCELIFQSQNVPGLQPVIAWRPLGGWIAGVVHSTKRCQLTMFEKNGLIRCSFMLDKNAKVEQLKWSPSGDVLAVYQSATTADAPTIDLYVFNNYVMYLKQRLQFQNANPLIDFEFLNSSSSMCIVRAITASEAATYSFKFVYHCSPFNRRQTGVIAASIKGAQALITRCKYGVMPPPTSEFTIDMDASINFVIFHPEQPNVALVDSSSTITLWDVDEDGVKKRGAFSLVSQPEWLLPLRFHHFFWGSDEEITWFGETGEADSPVIDVFKLNVQSLSCAEWSLAVDSCVDKGINYVGFIENSTDVIRQWGNKVFGSDRRIISVPSSVPLYTKATVISDKLYVFALTSTNQFYVNEVEAMRGIISFIVYDKYLFLTSVENNLIGVCLTELILSEFCKSNFRNIYVRLIEQGSHLLFVIPNTSYVVMQTPRGSIETCTCRIISVNRIETLLEKQVWNKALDLVRIEKLSTNVLVDLNLNRFLTNIGQFVELIGVPSLLNEFLLGLQEENVFSTIYSSCAVAAPVQAEVVGKRTLVCDRMIKYMEQNNYTYYISTIITACFVQNSPTCIKEALQHTQNILSCVNSDPSAINAAEEAFKSVYSLKPRDEIYETVLLMYDLDLVLFVARNMQMDPSEFEPFVNSLRSLTPIRLRFRINDFLKRYVQAAKYLIRCRENEDEILEYVNEHGLFKEAVWIVERGSSLFVEVTRVFAGLLCKKHCFLEAALHYLRASLLDEALEAYKLGLCWKEAIELMKKLGTPQARFDENLRIMIEGLKKEDRMQEACEIYENHLGDYETAIAILIEHKLFPAAIKLALKYNRNDIYVSDIAEGVDQYCSSLCDKIKVLRETYVKYTDRLKVVRNQKKDNLENQGNGLDILQHGNDESDLYSLAGSSTVASSARTGSSRTSRTSRSLRKQERKKHDLREGGVYEDIALMKALHELIHETFQWGPPVRELCLIALEFKVDLRQDIISMHNSLSQLQFDMKSGLKEIWPSDLNDNSRDSDIMGVYENINVLDLKYRGPPDNINTTWKLESFPDLK